MNWCTYCKFYNSASSFCKKYDTFAEIARRTNCIKNAGFVRNQLERNINLYTIKYVEANHPPKNK